MPKRKQPVDTYSSDDEEDRSDDDFDVNELMAVRPDLADEIKENASRLFMNNVDAMKLKTEEIALPKEWPWVETLVVSTIAPITATLNDVHDDLAREAEFYKQTLQGVKQGIIQLDHSGVVYKRPADFYAESIKPDSHMAKIKQVLINEKRRMEESEEKRKQREYKKFAKEVQSNKIKERQKEKRDNLEEISRMKKRTKHNEVRKDMESDQFGMSFDDGADDKKGGKSSGKGGKGEKKPDRPRFEDFGLDGKELPKGAGSDKKGGGGKLNGRRMAKDKKYGHGGGKKNAKANSSESSSDMGGFNTRKNKAMFPGFKDAPKGRGGSFKGNGSNKGGSFKGGNKGGSFKSSNKGGNRPGKNSRSHKR